PTGYAQRIFYVRCDHSSVLYFSLDRLYHNLFFFNATATTEIYTLSLHDALPISGAVRARARTSATTAPRRRPDVPAPAHLGGGRSEEHTSELQSLRHLVCRLLLEKKKKKKTKRTRIAEQQKQLVQLNSVSA